MKLSKILLMCIFGCLAAFSVSAGSELIWQIGQKDHNSSEFGLAGVGGYGQYLKQFPEDVSFVIGKDDPSQSWSYIHPGSGDDWAGSRKHPFTIKFNLEEKKHKAYSFDIHVQSAHHAVPPKLSVQINDESWDIETLPGTNDDAVRDVKAGRPQTHTLFFKESVLRSGANQITITTDGSWMVYDGLNLQGYSEVDNVTDLEATPQAGYFRQPDGDSCLIDLNFIGGALIKPATVRIQCQGKTTTRSIIPGGDVLKATQVYVPVVLDDEPVEADVTLVYGSKEISTSVELPPVRKWEIHLVHQTHLDIGYTHKQEDVLAHQVDHLHTALDCIDASKDNPEATTFKWHPEGMWAVEEFLRTESDEDKKKFIAETQKRNVHIDALYAQAMTGAYSEEELFELIGAAARYGKENGVLVNSAMQTDVPGYSWGIVNALAHHGVHYMSAAPNWGHRVGWTFEHADQPFYWESPCGKNRILMWLSGRRYCWAIGSTMTETFDKKLIDTYISDLQEQGYPYDLIMIRYGMSGDNVPPNPALPRFVKEWNDKYVWPKLIISRNSDLMQELEKRYADQLPVMRGDFTPYWEDGMASTSADVGISRRAAEQLVQAQTLWTMLKDGKAYPHDQFELAWNKLIMYDEHTWGSWDSISAPDSDFCIQQADYKQKYALDGASMTANLLERSLKGQQKATSKTFDVYNALNWDRSEIVLLSAADSTAGDRVEDADGQAVASQRLASGELAVLVENIPAFGAKRFVVKKGSPASGSAAVKVTSNTLSNGSVLVTIDAKTGAIKSLKHEGAGKEMVDQSRDFGVNDYLYILERDPSRNNMRIDAPVDVSIVDNGPLVGTLKIECDAPGANKLTRTVRVCSGSDVVVMDNVVDKLKERRPEGVYFNFPFNVPNGVMKIDTPWAVFEPEKDQLRGANRNFFCTQRFVDISNGDYGVTWMSVDAPLVQWDPIRIATPYPADDFRSSIKPNQTIHSWVMNNHWETNYKADQEGKIPFKYAVWPHAGGYDGQAVQRISRGVHQPLIAVPADPAKPVAESMLGVQGEGVVVTSFKPCRDGDGYMVRLFNTSDDVSMASVKWKKGPCTMWQSNPLEDKIEKINGTIKMVPQEITTVRVSF